MIPQIEPYIDERDVKEVTDAIRSTWVTESSRTERFELMFRELTGANYSRAYANGTATLFAAIKNLGIKEGEEIIAPAFTFIATINAIIFSGAKPVLVDIDKKTFCMDPKEVEKAITEKTRAIMPVHLYGQSCDMGAIMKIAKKHGLRVIEDAAQGVGVKFNGKHVGTFGDYGSFSFYGNKVITTGEGGMLITSNKELDEKALRFKNHGRLVKGFIHDEIGFNFNFTDLQAALGISQLNKLREIINKKRSIREKYYKLLKSLPGLEFCYIDPRSEPVHWFTSILVDDAGIVEEKLKSKGIQTRRFFYPMHWQPCYKNFYFYKKSFPNTEWAYAHGISLPSSVNITDKQIHEVCNALKETFIKNE